uniref:Uncharacterized protein n=1 Tax=Sphaerodactylus townsendi TaxID=933632 RepID=A0ACB8FYE7_9SAUR
MVVEIAGRLPAKTEATNTVLELRILLIMFRPPLNFLLAYPLHGFSAQSVPSASQHQASVKTGNTVKLSCSGISGYVRWFQQKPGNPPRFLLYYSSESSKGMGSGVPSRFSGSKNSSGNTSYLTITGALAEDEADYYCAYWPSNLLIMFWPLLVLLLVICCTGSMAQSAPSQPASVSVAPGNTVKLSCSGNGGYASWYQQKPGNPPRFLLYYSSESSKGMGSGVPSRFSGSKDSSGNTCYLTIMGALAEDEADYYCTMSSNGFHSDAVR